MHLMFSDVPIRICRMSSLSLDTAADTFSKNLSGFRWLVPMLEESGNALSAGNKENLWRNCLWSSACEISSSSASLFVSSVISCSSFFWSSLTRLNSTSCIDLTCCCTSECLLFSRRIIWVKMSSMSFTALLAEPLMDSTYVWSTFRSFSLFWMLCWIFRLVSSSSLCVWVISAASPVFSCRSQWCWRHFLQ